MFCAFLYDILNHTDVFDFPCRSGELVRQSDFEASVTAGWMSWGMNHAVYKPLVWAYDAVFKRNQQSLEGTFIVMDVLKVTFCFFV